ncbi:glycoside hydrolase family 16 protein [Poriferisphaera sp. WC338]|uniref:glycoside hydrolase family 16 protein n=1 Tax=Poriferisphaera sp. WC338 TaxID=3425129 RepID=UPI003D817CCC
MKVKMKAIVMCLGIGLGVSVFGVGATAGPPSTAYKLQWSDEFDGDALDLAKWTYTQEGRTRRSAFHRNDAVSVHNGNLNIRTYSALKNSSKPEQGYRHYTAIVGTRNEFLVHQNPDSTRETFLPTYGYMEARIKMTVDAGMWSAFWLQAPTMGTDISDPDGSGNEIDIIEYRGNGKSNNAVHWNGYGSNHRSWANEIPTHVVNPSDGQYHVYGLEWTEDQLKFYLDGTLRYTMTNPEVVSETREAIYFSSEVMTSGFAGAIPTGGYGAKGEAENPMMSVDYFRYYAVPEPTSLGVMAVLGALFMCKR